MIRFFVKNPITTIMFVLFWVVLGLVSFPNMNVERIPAMDFPMVTTTFVYPGATPDDMESQVVKKAEDKLSEIAGLKKITSQVFENGAFIMTEFNIGVDVDAKAAEVKTKIDSIADEFPTDLKTPVVEKLDPLAESVVDIVLSGAPLRDLQTFSDDVLSQKITALNGVSGVTIYGGEQRAIRVMADPDQLSARGATLSDLVSAIATHNTNVPGGRVDSTNSSSDIVRFVGEFAKVSDITDMKITTAEGDLFPLSAVARVTDSARDVETGARYNGENVVMVSVVKATDGNALVISDEIHKNMPDFERVMHDYFPNNNAVKMQIISDSSATVRTDTDGTIRDIVLGLVLTILTLIVFTRNWRTTIIAGVMIPASLISGFFFIDKSGFTINSMTLLAMATALGTLITDAIVLIESALSLIDSGMSPEDAAVDGTKRVSVRIFATIATHVVVFLPLAFMGGIAGQFMKQFGLTVVYLVLLSSMFSFTLTPMMIARILRKTKKSKAVKSQDRKETARPLAWFKPFFDFQMNHPWRTIGIAFLILVLSAIPLRWVGNEFTPNTDINQITITARAPSNATFAKSESVAAAIETAVHKNKNVEYTLSKIGERGMQNISIKVGLTPAADRNVTDRQIVAQILPTLADIPDAEIQIGAGQRIAGAVSDLVLNVTGPDDAKRMVLARQSAAIINNLPAVQSTTFAAADPGSELRFVPDADKMKFWGVSNAAAGVALRTAINGNDDYKFKDAGDEFPIIVEYAKPFKTTDAFQNVYVNTAKGMVLLSDLGRVEQTGGTPDILRINKQRVTEIDINIGKSTIGPVRSEIDSGLAKLKWDAGYGYTFGGMTEYQDESNGELSQAFFLATILTFMALAALMNSARQPFTIVTAIITSFSGVFIMLFLTGANINIAALLSLVMLVGLSVSTNILVMEPALEDIKRGTPPREALWNQFVDKKRMLAMVTVAVVAGLLPQLWANDGIKVSMGAVIIGGILASLFWTFFLTPAVFMLMERAKKSKHKK